MNRCIAIVSVLFFINSVDGAKNIVLLISDNQNQADCGCYENHVVQTPNIDQLARDGVRFRDCFATTASCGPSRAVIYTGVQTHRNGQYGHGHGYHSYRVLPTVDSVFKLLSKCGYQTALLGKRHTTPQESYPLTFEGNVNGRDVTGIAKLAEQFIQRADDKPFFLAVGYSDPHPTSIERPGWGIKRSDPAVPVTEYSVDDVIVPPYLPDRPEVREGLAGYYQEISRLDHGVGLILDVLKRTSHDDDTLVIFTSDHGSSEPGAMANHYEPGIRVPLIVRHPESEMVGMTNTALTTLADITPTILDWAEVKSNRPMHGRSILPILQTPNPTGWDEVILSHVCHEVTMYYPMRMIRNRRFKLIWNIDWRSEYPLPIDTLRRATWTETVRRGEPTIGKRSIEKYLFRDQVELYDLENDPDEVINLANDHKFASIRRELSESLTQWLTETQDPWLFRHRMPMPGESDSSSSLQADLNSSQGFQPIFNGTNLDGWVLRRADRGGYKVENGLLVCPADGGGYLFTEKEYDDFCFRFEFRLSEAANNGIGIRSPLIDAKPAYEGMELQILDNVGYPRKLRPDQYHGSLYGLAAAKRSALKPVGDWNHQQIWCKGRRVVVTLNDTAILDVNLDEVSTAEERGKHPGLLRTTGHIGLLGHGSRVEFRNLRVRRLP